jgi:hypothetical protein
VQTKRCGRRLVGEATCFRPPGADFFDIAAGSTFALPAAMAVLRSAAIRRETTDPAGEGLPVNRRVVPMTSGAETGR